MMYNWPLMIHIYFIWALFKFLSSFELTFTNGHIFSKKFFSRTCTLGKIVLQFTFDDSYNCHESKIDVFQSSLAVSFH